MDISYSLLKKIIIITSLIFRETKAWPLQYFWILVPEGRFFLVCSTSALAIQAISLICYSYILYNAQFFIANLVFLWFSKLIILHIQMYLFPLLCCFCHCRSWLIHRIRWPSWVVLFHECPFLRLPLPHRVSYIYVFKRETKIVQKWLPSLLPIFYGLI